MDAIRMAAETNLMPDARAYLQFEGFPNTQDLHISQLVSSQEVPVVEPRIDENSTFMTDYDFTNIKNETTSTIPSPTFNFAESAPHFDISQLLKYDVTTTNELKRSLLFAEITEPAEPLRSRRVARTNEERKERRKDSNRRAAEKSRNKKRQAEQVKDELYQEIVNENEKLREQLRQLRAYLISQTCQNCAQPMS